jgi:hypothetical protein
VTCAPVFREGAVWMALATASKIRNQVFGFLVIAALSDRCAYRLSNVGSNQPDTVPVIKDSYAVRG